MFSTNRIVIGICLILTYLFSGSTFAAPNELSTPLLDETYYNEMGMKDFKQGYYKLLPSGKKAEANKKIDQAEKSFLKAIEINDDYIDAHRNLARLYYVQKNFDQAAEEYAQVIRLNPENIDNYLNMALALTELGNFDEAIYYLEEAKTKTTDNQIIQKLNEYIAKIEQAE